MLVSTVAVFIAIAGWRGPVICPGCIDRSRDNATCAWTGDTAFRVEPRLPSHRHHLVHDAQLAEGLAVRFADAEHLRRFGIEHHGGLIDRGNVVRGCMARMFALVERHHSVTAEQIRLARAERNRVFDGAVVLLFLSIYVFISAAVWRELDRRFSADEPRVRLVAACLASIAVTVLGCYLFVLWSMPWETIRVGNGHIGGFRLATGNRHHIGGLLIGGLTAFWSVAFGYRRVPWGATLAGAALSCTLLAAMFARTFASTAAGYLVVLLALLGVVLALGIIGRRGGAHAWAAPSAPGPQRVPVSPDNAAHG